MSAKSQVPRIDLRLWVADRALERARRESFSGFRDEVPAPQGGLIVTLQTYSLEWVVRWLLSFGGDVEVLEPAGLRQRLAETARSVLEKHGEAVVS